MHVENTPLGVIEWGPDFRLSRWSAEAERIFGWRAEEVLGKRMGEFRWIDDEDVEHVDRVSAGLLDGTCPRSVSHNRNYRKDGSVVHCEWYNSSLLDESGKLRSILSLVLDVTERKRAEEALRESEERLRFALETNHTGAWELNLVDHTSHRSPGHDSIFGYAQMLPEWTYEMFLDHVVPEDRALVDDNFRHAVETQSDWSLECRIRRADGETRMDRGGRTTPFRCRWRNAQDGGYRPRHHRSKASGARTQASQGSRRGRQRGEEPVPGQHEPRTAHADERHPGHDRRGTAEGDRPDRPGLPANCQGIGRPALDAPERPAGLRQDRVGQTGTGIGPVQPAADVGPDYASPFRAGKREGTVLLLPHAGRDAGCGHGRPDAIAASPAQSGRERHQVHRARRS